MRQRVPRAPHPLQPRSIARRSAQHSPTHRRQHPTPLSGRRRPLQQSEQWPPRWWRRQRQRRSSAAQCGSSAATSTARRWDRRSRVNGSVSRVRDDGASGVRASAVLSLRALAPTRGARLHPQHGRRVARVRTVSLSLVNIGASMRIRR